jgi:hypothetical protein
MAVENIKNKCSKTPYADCQSAPRTFKGNFWNYRSQASGETKEMIFPRIVNTTEPRQKIHYRSKSERKK